jgi:hypothetical protein
VPALPARAEASQTVDLVLARRRPLVSSSGARPLHRRGRARVGAARSRCRAAAALLPEAKQQPRPSDPVLAHLRADEWGASGAANTSRAAGGAWEQQSGVATPGRCNLESRRAPARHGTRGSPRQGQWRLVAAYGRSDRSPRAGRLAGPQEGFPMAGYCIVAKQQQAAAARLVANQQPNAPRKEQRGL